MPSFLRLCQLRLLYLISTLMSGSKVRSYTRCKRQSASHRYLTEANIVELFKSAVTSSAQVARRPCRAQKAQLRQRTSFTCCAHDHFVGSCARPLRAKDALRPPACGPALAGSGRRSGHILACREDTASQNVKVKPTLSAILA